MKKIISMLILIIMIFYALVSMVACGGEASENGTEAPTDGESVVVEDVITHKVPKADFDGETFNSLAYRGTMAELYYFTDEESSGDVVKEALWQRTELIEEHLNCDLTFDLRDALECQQVVNELYNQNISDTDDYQQVLMHTIFCVASVVSNGMAYDFASLPHVELEAEWWDKEGMDDLRIGSIYPYGVSDFKISAPQAIMFNKTMLENLNLENPYDLVNDYRWTLDKMMSMATAAVSDANHDGRYTGLDDTFGIAFTGIPRLNAFLISCGQRVTEKNEEGRIELCINTEKTVKIVEKFYDFNSVRGAAYNQGVMYAASGVTHDMLFGDGRCLFVTHDLSMLEQLRNIDVNYGILPLPMYNEEQKEYKSMDWGPMWMISATIGNPELVGSVVELYSYFSGDTIVPAYYDKQLEGKLSQDIESRRMLELVFESVEFEILNNYFGFHSYLGDLMQTIGKLVLEDNSKNFASFYKGRENGAQKTLDEYYRNLEKNGYL